MSVLFLPVTKEDLAAYALEGLPVAEHGVDSLRAAARAAHLPDAVLDDEATLRPLLATLLVAGGAERLDRRSKGPGEAVSSALPDWLDLRPEARNYLLLVVRREQYGARTSLSLPHSFSLHHHFIITLLAQASSTARAWLTELTFVQ